MKQAQGSQNLESHRRSVTSQPIGHKHRPPLIAWIAMFYQLSVQNSSKTPQSSPSPHGPATRRYRSQLSIKNIKMEKIQTLKAFERLNDSMRSKNIVKHAKTNSYALKSV
jgi:hypothetical protein